jgi:hypothetical protein
MVSVFTINAFGREMYEKVGIICRGRKPGAVTGEPVDKMAMANSSVNT